MSVEFPPLRKVKITEGDTTEIIVGDNKGNVTGWTQTEKQTGIQSVITDIRYFTDEELKVKKRQLG